MWLSKGIGNERNKVSVLVEGGHGFLTTLRMCPCLLPVGPLIFAVVPAVLQPPLGSLLSRRLPPNTHLSNTNTDTYKKKITSQCSKCLPLIQEFWMRSFNRKDNYVIFSKIMYTFCNNQTYYIKINYSKVNKFYMQNWRKLITIKKNLQCN